MAWTRRDCSMSPGRQESPWTGWHSRAHAAPVRRDSPTDSQSASVAGRAVRQIRPARVMQYAGQRARRWRRFSNLVRRVFSCPRVARQSLQDRRSGPTSWDRGRLARCLVWCYRASESRPTDPFASSVQTAGEPPAVAGAPFLGTVGLGTATALGTEVPSATPARYANPPTTGSKSGEACFAETGYRGCSIALERTAGIHRGRQRCGRNGHVG